ncbi:FAD-binding oxidoreductase [Sphingosinicellaceae bacterium]|nr:FAD-binding oxidoreductase [Sphingosinicellaceae bacterium]
MTRSPQRLARKPRSRYGNWVIAPTTLDPAAYVDLTAAVGEGNWYDDPEALAPHLVDWRGAVHGRASLLLRPRTTAAVVRIVEAAARHRVALVPQGGNTGLVGGGIPDMSGGAVLLSLARMDRIRDVDAAGLTLTCEAGAVLANVHDAARAAGCEFPLSLGAKGSATIGGLVSTNAGGVQVLRHGTMRALVAGLEAVLPDGRVLHQLTGLAKDNSGYDIKQLLIGGEGTLGIVTAVALRLVPAPAHRAVAWAGLADPHAALKLLTRLRRASGGQVESFELIPADGLALTVQHIEGIRSPLAREHAWHVLVELAGPASLDELLTEALGEAAMAGEIEDATVAASTAQAAALWRIREELPEAERRDGPSLHHDISVAVAAMPGFTIDTGAEVEAAFPGARILSFGHLGDGNLHFNVRPPADAEPRAWLAANGGPVTTLVYDLVTAAGGSISAEHGIGILKREMLVRTADPAKLSAMRAVKAALDPLGIMNPGKIL